MPSATTTTPRTPCPHCGRPLSGNPGARARHLQTHQRPGCGCTTAGQRCTEARRRRAMFEVARELGDSPGMQLHREAYGAHLRQAGVAPGQAQWEDTP